MSLIYFGEIIAQLTFSVSMQKINENEWPGLKKTKKESSNDIGKDYAIRVYEVKADKA